MIGGEDFIIPVTTGPLALELAVRAVHSTWPQAVFEDAETGRRFPKMASIPFTKCKEIFIYKDAQAADQWEELGADKTLIDTMIHLMISSGSLTVVVDHNPSKSMKSLVAQIKEAVGRKSRRASGF
jgi:hypothetical protein